MSIIEKVQPYWKAVVAFVVPGLVALGGALQPGSDGGHAVTAAEWIVIALACLGTTGVVYAVPNKPNPEPEPLEPADDPGDHEIAEL